MATVTPRGNRQRLSQERKLVGWASLAISGLLLLMILVRGQQAAHDGNQELRNDAYAVLVSPLALAVMGFFLLRSPRRPKEGDAAAGSLSPLSEPVAIGRTASANRRLGASSSSTSDQELAEAKASEQRLRASLAAAEARAAQLEQQLEDMRSSNQDSDQNQTFVTETKLELERKLALVQADLTQAHAAAKAAEQRLHQESGQNSARITSLEQQLVQAKQAHQEAELARTAIAEASADAESGLAKAQSELNHYKEALEAAERQRSLVNLEAQARIQELEGQLKQKQDPLITSPSQLTDQEQAAIVEMNLALDQKLALAEAELHQAHAAAKVAAESMQQKSEQASARTTMLEQQLEKARQAEQEAERARQAIAKASVETESRLAEAESELKKSQKTVEQVAGQLSLVKRQAQARIQALEGQLKQQQHSLSSLQTKLSDQEQAFGVESKHELERKLAQVEADLLQAHAAAQGAEHRSHEESEHARSRIKNLEQQLEQARQAQQEADRAQKAIAQSSAEMETRLVEAQSELKRFQEALHEAEGRHNLVHLQAKEHIQELEGRLAQQQDALTILETKLAERNQSSSTNETEPEVEHQTELEHKLALVEADLQQALAAAQAAEQRLQEESEQTTARIINLEQQLDEAREEADQAHKAIAEGSADAESRLAQAQSELKQSQTAAADAEHQLSLVKRQAEARIQDLERQLAQQQQSLIALQDQINAGQQASRAEARAAGHQATSLRSRHHQTSASPGDVALHPTLVKVPLISECSRG